MKKKYKVEQQDEEEEEEGGNRGRGCWYLWKIDRGARVPSSTGRHSARARPTRRKYIRERGAIVALMERIACSTV